MSSTAFIEPLPVIEFVTQLLNRDVSARPLSDADRVKVSTKMFLFLDLVFTVICIFSHELSCSIDSHVQLGYLRGFIG